MRKTTHSIMSAAIPSGHLLVDGADEEPLASEVGFGSDDALPSLEGFPLENLSARQLRIAIRRNLVTFPGQIPIFVRHDRPDLQRKIVQLYFLLGWSCGKIAVRQDLIRQRVGQILRVWKKRAIEMGYIQFIPSLESIAWPNKPIHVTLYSIVNQTLTPERPGNDVLPWPAAPSQRQPRRTTDLGQILQALRQLADGKPAWELANELQVAPQTIGSWRVKYGHWVNHVEEMETLRRENARLLTLVETLGNGAATL